MLIRQLDSLSAFELHVKMQDDRDRVFWLFLKLLVALDKEMSQAELIENIRTRVKLEDYGVENVSLVLMDPLATACFTNTRLTILDSGIRLSGHL